METLPSLDAEPAARGEWMGIAVHGPSVHANRIVSKIADILYS